jgi:CheY-like chemotaxis protein
LRNAIKFTPSGGSITVNARDEGDSLRIDVADNGIGIEAAVLARIFRPFEQGGDGITRQYGGLGLGLAISRRLAEAQGAALEARSDGPGLGSTFTLRLPSLQTPARPQQAPPTPKRDSSATHLRLLVVEDHADTLRAMTRLLRNMGHDVHAAPSAAEAFSAAQQNNFDLVISDLALPDASGFELMAKLKAMYGLRGVALSGYGMEHDLQQSRDAGFVRHLVKPVSADQLAATIENAAAAPAEL